MKDAHEFWRRDTRWGVFAIKFTNTEMRLYEVKSDHNQTDVLKLFKGKPESIRNGDFQNESNILDIGSDLIKYLFEHTRESKS